MIVFFESRWVPAGKSRWLQWNRQHAIMGISYHIRAAYGGKTRNGGEGERERQGWATGPWKNREAGWLLIYFFLRPPLFSIGTKTDSAPLVSHHPTVRNLTLCKQPERKKEVISTDSRESSGTKKRVSRCASLSVHYLVVKKKRSKKARCTVQSRVGLKSYNKTFVISCMYMQGSSSLMAWFNERLFCRGYSLNNEITCNII